MLLNISKIKNLLEDKKILLIEMLDITKSQKIAIKNEELERLHYLIDDKEKLIEKINIIDSEVKEILGDTSIRDNDLSKEYNYIKIILMNIKTIDDQNNEKLCDNFSKMKLNLKEVRCGQRAMKNYGNSDPYQSFVSQGGTLFIDQDS